MKKLVMPLSFVLVLGLCFVFSGIVEAYTNRFHIELDNESEVTTESRKVDVSYSNELKHSLVMHGTDKTEINSIFVSLETKTFFGWKNLGYFTYATLGKNQLMTNTFGVFPNGNYRSVFKTNSYAYQGIYYVMLNILLYNNK